MEINVFNSEGKVSGTAKLPDTLLKSQSSADGSKLNLHTVHEVVTAYLSNQRRGTHATLTRGNVRGGGKKPWKQKHTGRARAGTSRSPLWRGGGIIFGPHPRSYRVNLPHAKIKSALARVLLAKAQSGDVIVSEKPQLNEVKTKVVTEWLKKLSLPLRSLLVVDKTDEKLLTASRNLSDFHVVPAGNLHPYYLLKAKKIVFTPEAVKCL